jgi:hypothetical protein
MTLSTLKGISGEFEINRVIGAVGALAYIAPPEVMWRGRPFDLVAWAPPFIAIGAIVAIDRIAVATAALADLTSLAAVKAYAVWMATMIGAAASARWPISPGRWGSPPSR